MAVELHSVQLLNRLLRLPLTHVDKAEAFGAAGITVPHNTHEHHMSDPLEQTAELVLCGGGREIPNIDPLRHRSPLSYAPPQPSETARRGSPLSYTPEPTAIDRST